MFDLMPWRKRAGSDLVGFKKEMDNLFNRFFEFDFPQSREFTKAGEWALRLDVTESEKQITVKAEIPGCDVGDIDISLEGRRLTIRGEKKEEKEEQEKNYLRVERAHGLFSRTLELPTEVDESAVEATYKKGVLTVVLNKTNPSESRKIEIQTS